LRFGWSRVAWRPGPMSNKRLKNNPCRQGAWFRWLALLLLVALLPGCMMPRSWTGLDAVLEQELGRDVRLTPDYWCTAGAHRGSSVEFTENTLEALRAADDESRYAFIEFDVQYSEDNRIVVFHDKRLFRLFGSLRSVGSSTFAELQELTGGEVCAYDDAMDALHKKLNIEIKSQGDEEEDERLADELIADLQARGREKDVLISSISSDLIRYVKRQYPQMRTGKIFWLTSSTYLHFDVLTRRLYDEMDELGADYLLLHVANLRNIEDLLRLKPKGRTVIFWDFDDRIYLVHKDLSDRVWGVSGARNFVQYVWYRLFSPPRSESLPE